MQGSSSSRKDSGAGSPPARGDVGTEAASLTADLMMRGRQRARQLVDPVLAEAQAPARRQAAERPSRSRRLPLPTFLRAVSRRDVALVLIWMTVFFGSVLLVWWSD